jgi:hypothetical protein
MTTSGKDELLTAIREAVSQLQALMASLEPGQVNRIPYPASWTAGQLLRHVSKSIEAMGKAMGLAAKPAARDAGQKIAELRKTFLDFSHPLKSPDFILPENGPYEKGAILEELEESFQQLEENTRQATLTHLVEGLPLGAVTKLEILHFVLYHTQRHVHQMKRIGDALKQQPRPLD